MSKKKSNFVNPPYDNIGPWMDQENQQLLDAMEQAGVIRKLKKYKNWYEQLSFFNRIDFCLSVISLQQIHEMLLVSNHEQLSALKT